MSNVQKPMESCEWCMQPAFAVAAPVLCASSVNGMAAPPPSRARSVCFCTHCSSGLSPSSGVTGVAGSIGGRVCNSLSPTCGGADRTASFCRSNAPTCASVSCAAGSLSADVYKNDWRTILGFPQLAGDHQTVRRPSRLCHLARPGDGLNRAFGAPWCSLSSDSQTPPGGTL